jgi:hypothetical protein
VCIGLQATYKLIFGAKFGFLTIRVLWENKEYKKNIIEIMVNNEVKIIKGLQSLMKEKYKM